MHKRLGVSYKKRVADINRIYDEHVKRGLPNREIWRRYIYPVYAISERTFYNILNASADPTNDVPKDTQLFFDFAQYDESVEYRSRYPQDTQGYQDRPR